MKIERSLDMITRFEAFLPRFFGKDHTPIISEKLMDDASYTKNKQSETVFTPLDATISYSTIHSYLLQKLQKEAGIEKPKLTMLDLKAQINPNDLFEYNVAAFPDTAIAHMTKNGKEVASLYHFKNPSITHTKNRDDSSHAIKFTVEQAEDYRIIHDLDLNQAHQYLMTGRESGLVYHTLIEHLADSEQIRSVQEHKATPVFYQHSINRTDAFHRTTHRFVEYEVQIETRSSRLKANVQAFDLVTGELLYTSQSSARVVPNHIFFEQLRR